jgi:hypothetical protein
VLEDRTSIMAKNLAFKPQNDIIRMFHSGFVKE